MNRKHIIATLTIILGVALCWAAPPVDKLPSLLTTPAEARNISVIVGGSPPTPAGDGPNQWFYSQDGSGKSDSSFTTSASLNANDEVGNVVYAFTSTGTVTKVAFKTDSAVTAKIKTLYSHDAGDTYIQKDCQEVTTVDGGWTEVTIATPFNITDTELDGVVVAITSASGFYVLRDDDATGHRATGMTYSTYCSGAFSWADHTNYNYGVKVYLD